MAQLLFILFYWQFSKKSWRATLQVPTEGAAYNLAANKGGHQENLREIRGAEIFVYYNKHIWSLWDFHNDWIQENGEGSQRYCTSQIMQIHSWGYGIGHVKKLWKD